MVPLEVQIAVLGLLLLALVTAATIALIRRATRRRQQVRDDTLRVGVEPSPDPGQAAGRAQGKAAWTLLPGP
ncbi:hypothetical protein OVN18_01165 [Microcella daejeonensis]|uniref:Uncharacterized protein n=1 Tax=Microcella daejeonensis TaxID=2994971 RepID=A0A9E8MLG9_9MICO|nr:hypothetical protein [Microcella daejeonensis]WAB81659.1 hypothetical protein OVN18_01165 [Microcella daejeonensis]WAB83810.1 hypothetical protein OVN20_12355 [Microcella daejeonensis]